MRRSIIPDNFAVAYEVAYFTHHSRQYGQSARQNWVSARQRLLGRREDQNSMVFGEPET